MFAEGIPTLSRAYRHQVDSFAATVFEIDSNTNGIKLRGPAYFFASCGIMGIAEGQGAAVSNRRRMKTVELTGMSLKRTGMSLTPMALK